MLVPSMAKNLVWEGTSISCHAYSLSKKENPMDLILLLCSLALVREFYLVMRPPKAVPAIYRRSI